jgi:hypothetical protein
MLIPWEWNVWERDSLSVGTPSTAWRSRTSLGMAWSTRNFANSLTKDSSFSIFGVSEGAKVTPFLKTFVL